MFDSVYTDIDVNTEGMICGMFEQPIDIQLQPGVPKQEGSTMELYAKPPALYYHTKKHLQYKQFLLCPCLISSFGKLCSSPFQKSFCFVTQMKPCDTDEGMKAIETDVLSTL